MPSLLGLCCWAQKIDSRNKGSLGSRQRGATWTSTVPHSLSEQIRGRETKGKGPTFGSYTVSPAAISAWSSGHAHTVTTFTESPKQCPRNGSSSWVLPYFLKPWLDCLEIRHFQPVRGKSDLVFSVKSCLVWMCVCTCVWKCMCVCVGAGYWKLVYTAGEEAVCRYLIPEDGYRIKKYVFSSLFKNTTFHNGVIKIIIWGLIEPTGGSWAFCFIVLFIFFNLVVFYATFSQICCVISGLPVIWI